MRCRIAAASALRCSTAWARSSSPSGSTRPGPAWQMPQGRHRQGRRPARRSPGANCRRRPASPAPSCWPRAKLADLRPAAGTRRDLWKGKYRGQEQKWYAFRFTGAESEIDIEGEHPEFSSWKWVDFRQVAELIVPFKRVLYEKVVLEFSHLAG